jgi:hypothetical protein
MRSVIRLPETMMVTWMVPYFSVTAGPATVLLAGRVVEGLGDGVVVWVARLLAVWVDRLLSAAVDLVLAVEEGAARLGKVVGVGAAPARGAFWATVGSGPSLAIITSVMPAVAPINANAARRTLAS